MATWTNDELTRIGDADELQIQSTRSDGTLRKPVTIWVVRAGNDLYVRSVGGRDGRWFHGTQNRHEGHIQAGGIDKDVTFEDAGSDLSDAIDNAYRAKYGNYPAPFVDPTVTPAAQAATLRLVPQEIHA
ncbi:MAG TPA: DUF2255 family protein [Thermomicrobiales bacterium]|nr:DUF2255 family protein [Thermomicrobiales bacterium]